jgi:hypothetical protein
LRPPFGSRRPSPTTRFLWWCADDRIAYLDRRWTGLGRLPRAIGAGANPMAGGNEPGAALRPGSGLG